MIIKNKISKNHPAYKWREKHIKYIPKCNRSHYIYTLKYHTSLFKNLDKVVKSFTTSSLPCRMIEKLGSVANFETGQKGWLGISCRFMQSRHRIVVLGTYRPRNHLTFLDHSNRFNASQGTLYGPKTLKSHHLDVTTLSLHLLQITVAELISQVPPNTKKDCLLPKTTGLWNGSWA